MRRSRIVGLLTAIAAFAAPIPATAADSFAVAITDARVTGGPEPMLVLSGSFTNLGSEPISMQLTLVTSGPLPTRSALDGLLRATQTPATRPLPVTADVADVAPSATRAWTLTSAMSPWANQWSGVLGVGVQSGGQVALTAVPWFPEPASDPTRLTVAVRLNVAGADPYAETPDLTAAAAELDRMERLVYSGFGQLVVDPQVPAWLDTLQGTALAQRAAALSARVASSTSSVYADARLDRLVVSNRMDLVDAISGRSVPWYFPDAATSDVVGALGDRVVTVIGNDQVAQSALETTAAAGEIDGQPVLIADRGAEYCLALPSSSAASLCFAATVAMVTAESPNRARQLLVATPRGWDPDVLLLSRLATAAATTGYSAAGNLTVPPADAGELRLRPPAAEIPSYSERALGNVSTLLDTATQVGSLFPNSTQDEQLRNLAIGALSQNVSRSQAADLLRRGLDAGRLITSSVAIETSGRFAVPGTSVELPFTIVNNAELPVTVGVVLLPDNPSRLSAEPVPAVVVDSGQRVVVQQPITITGVGTVTGAVRVITAEGTEIGPAVQVSVTSTAGQRFARNLVWLAFATLVLLAANSWRRRREAQ